MHLGVNIDHVATLRQARRGHWPDPIEASRVCERAGADSIVCHLREDRRHIQDDDVRRLNAMVRTHLNLEMSIAPSVVAVALEVRPAQVTLVPERRQELTTEGGLNLVTLAARLRPLLRRFRQAGIVVSVFIDPVAKQVSAARDLGIESIELHTGGYANAPPGATRTRALATVAGAARQAASQGFTVAAGHGLDYENVSAIAQIPELEELNIGFSIIARAMTVGLECAVQEMVARLQFQRQRSFHATQAHRAT